MPTVNIVYLVDEKDAPAGSARYVTGPRPPRNGITEYALRAGRTLLLDSRTLDELDAQGKLVRRGSRSSSWLGVPLRTEQRTLGMMVVQSYRPRVRYGDEDAEILEYVSSLVAMVIERRRAHDELEASERRLREHAAALERSNAELEQFACIASHDLQEPLRGIAGFLQLLERRHGESLDAKGKEYVSRAVAAMKRMQGMIEDLLDYFRITTRGEDPVATDSRGALGQAIENLRLP